MKALQLVVLSIVCFLQLLVERCSAQLSPDLDCTQNGGPEVDGNILSSSSLGALITGNINLAQNGTVTSPSVPITAVIGVNNTFSIFRQEGFDGYLVRVFGAEGVFFLEDSLDVGVVSFCSALGLLDSSSVNISPVSPISTAGFVLLFQGATDFQMLMDVVVSVTSGTTYDYFYDRYTINVVVSSDSTTVPVPTMPPSLRGSEEPTPSVIETTLEPTVSPLSESAQPTSPPPVVVTVPTLAPTVSPLEQSAEPSSPPPVAELPLEPTASPLEQTTEPSSPPPVAQPTFEPTASPTLTPTVLPVTSSAAPSIKEPEKTKQPSISTDTEEPTLEPPPNNEPEPKPDDFKSARVRNLRITLQGVSSMDVMTVKQFETATKAWFEEYYRAENRNRRRQLQEQPGTMMSNFSTIITVQSQTVTAANSRAPVRNAVAYEQEIFYLLPNENSTSPDALNVVTVPFKNEASLEDYFDNLRISSPAFENVSKVTPDEDVSEVTDGDEKADDGDGFQMVFIYALGGVAALMVLGLALLVWHRRRQVKENRSVTEKTKAESRSDYYGSNSQPHATVVVSGDEVSALYTPSVAGFSYDAEQSMSTVDYDYAKVANAGGNRSIISSAGGTLGENTRQDSLTQITQVSPLTPMGDNFSANSAWDNQNMNNSKKGAKYFDEKHMYTVNAPSGKLGVVVDTPDEGPPVIFAVKDTSVLLGKVNVGDRLLSVDDQDVTAMSAVNISRLISKKADEPVRRFTLMRSPANRVRS